MAKFDPTTTKNNKTVTTGASIIQGVLQFISNGGSIVALLQGAVVGLVLSPFLALSNIIQAVGNFFATPFQQGGIAIGELINALFTAPARLLATGAQITEDVLRLFLADNLAGFLAFPIAVALVLGSFFLVLNYLQEEETGDTLPFVAFDVPDLGPLQFGVEEEDDAAD